MKQDGTPYMPSNGSEGDGFMEKWCYKCKHDGIGKPEDDESVCDKWCEVLSDSMNNDTIPEWVYKNGNPVCTSFSKYAPEEEGKEDYGENPNQLDLFTN